MTNEGWGDRKIDALTDCLTALLFHQDFEHCSLSHACEYLQIKTQGELMWACVSRRIYTLYAYEFTPLSRGDYSTIEIL